MNLFNITDLEITPQQDSAKFMGLNISSNSPVFLMGNKKDMIKKAIGNLEGETIFYLTDGAWSNIDLVSYILERTGPANLFFTTWSIAADTIAKLNVWKESGLIMSIHAILDQGIRNRKPEVLQQALGTFTNLKLIKCHAKVTVIQNEHDSIVLMGSANYTKNPRKETGLIIRNKELADANINWILEEFR